MHKSLSAGGLDQILTVAEAAAAKPSLDGVQSSLSALMEAWPSDRGLYVQLKRLATFIEQTRAEIASLRPDDVKGSILPMASDELDAIVAATAEASTRIMDAADILMDIASALTPEQSGKVIAAATSIYEACSFQDITGQRITKVIKSLKIIEDRIDHMLRSLPDEDPIPSPPPRASNEDPALASDRSLLNGPALPGQGRTQSEIDALLGVT